jgi:predicted negative regulator of RcsB-dependent stress response
MYSSSSSDSPASVPSRFMSTPALAQDDRYEATALACLGDALAANGDTDAAWASWQQALTILDQLDHPDADEVRTKLKFQPRS